MLTITGEVRKVLPDQYKNRDGKEVDQAILMIESNDRCLCYTEQATPLPVNLHMCREIVSNGYYRDWGDIGTRKMEAREERAPATPASTPSPPSHTYPIQHFPRTANLGNFSVEY